MAQIVVEVGKQMNGATFQLSPRTRMMLAKRDLGVTPATSVFVAFDTKKAFEDRLGQMWPQIVVLLTGLTAEEVENLGGFSIVNPADDEVLFQSHAA